MSTDASKEELLTKLGLMEDALQRSERLAVANRYAGAVIHEVNNPLEAITNLVYLTKHAPGNKSAVIRNIEAKDFDLVEIAESALLIHSRRSQRQNVEIRREIAGPATAR